MAPRFSFFVSVLVFSFISANARNLAIFQKIVQMDSKAQGESNISRNKKLCSQCEEYASEAINYLIKLKDHDAEVIERLLKECDKMGSNAEQCKESAFQFRQLVLIDAVTFLKTKNVCTAIHACKNSSDLTGSSSNLSDA